MPNAVVTNGSFAGNNIFSTLAANTAHTFSYTCPANTDCLVLVESCVGSGGAVAPPTALTYNGVSLTMVPGSSAVNSAASQEGSIWYILASNLTTGSSLTVSVTYANTVFNGEWVLIPLKNTNQIYPVGTAAVANGTSAAPAVTATGGGSNDLYIGSMQSGSATVSDTGTGQTQLGAQIHVYSAVLSDISGSTFPGAFSWSIASSLAYNASAVAFFSNNPRDPLTTGSTTDLVSYNSITWNYVTPAATNWIDVGPTGAFCNLNSGGNPAFAFYTGSFLQFTADQQAQCTLASSVTGAFAGIAVRLTSGFMGPTGYFVWFDSAHYNIGVSNNGVLTSLIGGPLALTSNVGDIFTLTVQGSTLTFSKNGITVKTVTDTTVTSGNPGLAFQGTHPSTVINNFVGTSLGTNLTGQTTNSTIGQISEIVSYKPTAQTGSFTVGAPTDALTLRLGGQTASFAEGALVFVENITGQSAAFTEGVITASTSGNITVNFGAQSSQFAQGQLFDFISYVLDQGANVAQLFSQTATFVQGTIGLEADYFPLAFTVTSTEGVATSALADSLGALAFVSSEGLITANAGTNVNNTFSAQTLTSSEGVLNLEADYFPLAQTLAFTEGMITFSSAGDFTVTLSGTFGTFAPGAMVPSVVNVIPITPAGVYPNLAGLILDEATQQLEVAGAIVPASIGYFGTWPITVNWVPSQVPPFVVLSQSIPPLAPIVVNAPIRLTVSQPSENVAYP